MGQGLEIYLGEPSEAATLEDCLESEFVRTLVCQAGLVMAGEKPAAIFGFSARARGYQAASRQKRALSARLLSVYAKKLRAYGVHLVGLARKADGLMLLAWRPSLVEGLLDTPGNQAFICEAGLDPQNPRALVSGITRRLRDYYQGRRAFPHEVGLLLGYPVADVAAFMQDGGRGAVAVGRWRCYGDVPAARLRFEELDRIERRCKHLYLAGVPVTELLEAGAA